MEGDSDAVFAATARQLLAEVKGALAEERGPVIEGGNAHGGDIEPVAGGRAAGAEGAAAGEQLARLTCLPRPPPGSCVAFAVAACTAVPDGDDDL